MEYAIINSPAAPLRRKPRHSSEMVNQLLFGETVRLLKRRNELWVKVRSLHDNYEGWMTITLLEPMKQKPGDTQTFYAADLLSKLRIGNRILHVPFGSSLPGYEGGSGLMNGAEYSYEGNVLQPGNTGQAVEDLRQRAIPWLNVPYLWGGRTPLGVDCSGLVQVLFQTQGISLPRDAWQQAQSGMHIKKFRDAKPGDLLFFDEKEEIVHVGILFEPGVMIHSSGKVRLDAVDKKGLVDPEIKSRKLRLQMIRRVFSVDSLQSSVVSPQSTVVSQQSTVVSPQSTIVNPQSTVVNPQSRASNSED